MRPSLRNRAVRIHLFATLLCVFCSDALSHFSPSPQQYPEVAWLGQSTYCNPYFGFRLALPPGFHFEPIHLPVQTKGRHMLLAMHLQRLDRSADIFISAFADRSENPARLAAKALGKQAHARGLSTSGPASVSLHEHKMYRLHVIGDPQGSGDESSYFFELRGYVVHITVSSHEHDLQDALNSAIEHHLEFVEAGDSACQAASIPAASSPPSISAPADSHPAISASAHSNPAPSNPGRLYFGPALPTDLVEATVRDAPGKSVPSGQFSKAIFADPSLGVRVVLPPGWQTIPNDEAYRVTELMRDPTTDHEINDRRRALFRACSRVVFTATDQDTELISQVHPTLVIAAMPQGCVPDMVPPASPDDRAAAEEFATVLVRSLGVPLLGRGRIRGDSAGHITFDLDGALPYHLPSEKLSRRLSLRVSALPSGPWLIFIYSVTPTPSALRDLESHIAIRSPDPKEKLSP